MRDAVIERFRRELPGVKIRPRIRNGTERKRVLTKPTDGRNAVRDDVCHCTIANAMRRELRVPGALIERTVAYLLEPAGGGWYEVFKYEHDGRSIADALDLHGVGVVRAVVTLRPPSKFRRVGAQTEAQKTRAERARRQPQTPEHKAKRGAAIRRSAEVNRRRRIAGDIRD